ncbi:unnamed protein product [Polarella glacialis]|uniref:Uncharacterized protein n=1 Tax=Polarella glacialis TaxID=89957 RepID=A0A813FJJ8_POLGL|nr:unnamed protein product [Polarella glacialis]CAE8688092.1 unnamed protein product [Polarella glacialis]
MGCYNSKAATAAVEPKQLESNEAAKDAKLTEPATDMLDSEKTNPAEITPIIPDVADNELDVFVKEVIPEAPACGCFA